MISPSLLPMTMLVILLAWTDRSPTVPNLGTASRQLISMVIYNSANLIVNSVAKSFFGRAGLPLARTWWVRSTFSSHYPLSSYQRCWLTSATSIIFLWKNSRMLGVKPWAAGWEASMLPQFNAAPHPPHTHLWPNLWHNLVQHHGQ